MDFDLHFSNKIATKTTSNNTTHVCASMPHDLYNACAARGLQLIIGHPRGDFPDAIGQRFIHLVDMIVGLDAKVEKSNLMQMLSFNILCYHTLYEFHEIIEIV
jgi:hypothetical protein